MPSSDGVSYRVGGTSHIGVERGSRPGVVALPSEPMRPTSSSFVHESMYTSRRRNADASTVFSIHWSSRKRCAGAPSWNCGHRFRSCRRIGTDESFTRASVRPTKSASSATTGPSAAARWKYQTPPLTFPGAGVERSKLAIIVTLAKAPLR